MSNEHTVKERLERLEKQMSGLSKLIPDIVDNETKLVDNNKQAKEFASKAIDVFKGHEDRLSRLETGIQLLHLMIKMVHDGTDKETKVGDIPQETQEKLASNKLADIAKACEELARSRNNEN